jgi:hypothetical protein
MERAICVYCGARVGDDPAHTTAARQLGAALAQRGWSLIYGGGSIGLMGLVASSALESGGRVVGVIPQALREREVMMTSVTELVVTNTLRERKQDMDDRADAFVAMPGGFGTFEELLEVLTLRQLGYHDKPIVLLNVNGYYDPLLRLFRHAVTQGYVAETQLSLYDVATTAEEAMQVLEQKIGTFV